ncbi:hypothetical protein [Antarcticirhabdus aurantiaca]|uniref:Uncharacterized protein n=1 Tax=Antarcticirhabdus aurantiaca TaxID=2606717 RepID=A0ACD4NQA7_9HYPH|nr:hypothetical protein [Antarcticirhabdus aurantiaca]WAJ28951.1 hypothetical protein OXU80_01480 [Jeongeuplla avenae]
MFVEEVLVRSISDLGATAPVASIAPDGRAVLGRSAAGPRGAPA